MLTREQVRTLTIRIAVIGAVAAAAWAMMSVYSSGPSYKAYVAPAQAIVRAALAGDSTDLARQGAEPAVIRWAVRAAREDTVALRALERGLHLGRGTRKGDTTVVWFSARARGQCVYWSLRLFFVGRGAARRIGKGEVYCSVPVSRPPGEVASTSAPEL
jgi:hypothetical protein